MCYVMKFKALLDMLRRDPPTFRSQEPLQEAFQHTKQRGLGVSYFIIPYYISACFSPAIAIYKQAYRNRWLLQYKKGISSPSRKEN
jgi:hypothetical protein